MGSSRHEVGGRSRAAAMRGTPSLLLLALALTGAVIAAIAANKAGALTSAPTKAVLGVTIPLWYGTSLAAIGTSGRRRPEPLRGRPVRTRVARKRPDRPHAGVEVDAVEQWRRIRLAALGAPEATTVVIAADDRYDVHELERLVAAGCPVDTALRILHPD